MLDFGASTSLGSAPLRRTNVNAMTSCLRFSIGRDRCIAELESRNRMLEQLRMAKNAWIGWSGAADFAGLACGRILWFG